MRVNKLLRFLSIGLLASSIFTSFVNVPKASAAACPSKPYLVAAPSIGIAGEYAAWLQAKQPTTSAAKVFVSSDGGASCQEFKKASDAWGWVSGAGGTTKINLAAGAASIRIYVTGGETHLANLLLTLDTGCAPTGDGSNCVQQPLQLSVSGIQQGDIVSGSVTVETFVANKTINGARVEYYLDNAATPYSASTQSPYCLVLTANKCAGWPSSSLSNGQHKLTIRGVSEGNPTEKIITFTVNNASSSPAPSPTPTPTPTPSPTASPSPSPSPTPSPTPVTARPTPAPSPSPTPSTTTSTGSVTPAKVTTKTSVKIPTDTKQIAAQNSVVPTGTSQNDTSTASTPTPTQSTIIENLDTTDKNKSTTTPALVAGLSVAGTLKGSVIITTPRDVTLEIGDMIELLVDGKLIETKTVDTPVATASFTLDTTKLKNGKSVISMRVTRENGEISTYSSNVEIANGTVASTVGTAKKSWLSIVLSVLGVLILVLSLVFLARYIISKRQYEEAHNIQNYTYVQPENPYYPAAGATLAVLFAVVAVLSIRGSSNAANVGYIYKISDGTIPQEFALANDTTNNLAYVKLSDDGTTTGTDPHAGHLPTDPTFPTTPATPTTPTTPMTPTTPTTPPVSVGSADYTSNLALLQAAASRNKMWDNAGRVNKKSVDLINDPDVYGDPNDFNTHRAYNPGILGAPQAFFRAECAFSHFGYDDPIVYPNKPGASHLHMFFGNTHANAYSTYGSLIDSGNSTCTGRELNRTAYWVPAMIDDKGNARVPDRTLVYYKAGSDSSGGKVNVYPEGAKFIATIDTEYATAFPADPFSCFYANPGKSPGNCSSGANSWDRQLVMHVAFRYCLKQGADVTDYKNNTLLHKWSDKAGSWWWHACPDGTLSLPLLKYNVFYQLEPGDDSSKWYLSSDVDRNTKQKTVPSGSTTHADWFGAWNKEINKTWVTNCLNAPTAKVTGADCAYGSLAPCIQISQQFACTKYAPGYEQKALKIVEPTNPGYNKIPLKQIRKEVCPQAPLPDTASSYEYSYCVNP